MCGEKLCIFQTMSPNPESTVHVVLAFLLLGLAGVVDQDLVEKGAAGGLLEEIDDRVVHRVAVLVQPSKYGLINTRPSPYLLQ